MRTRWGSEWARENARSRLKLLQASVVHTFVAERDLRLMYYNLECTASKLGGDSKMAAWCHAHCWGVVLKLDSYNVTMWPSDWVVPVQHEAGRSCIQGFSAWRKTAWGRLRASSKCHPQQMSVLSLTILEEYRRHYQEFDSGGDNKSLVICISKNFYALSENADKFELHMNDHILWAPRPRQEYALMAKRWKV